MSEASNNFDKEIFKIAGTDKNPLPDDAKKIYACVLMRKRERDIYRESKRERESEIQLQARRDRYRHVETETNTERQRQKDTNIVKETERGRHNEIERQR